MRILAITGSPRGPQSNTKKLVERVLEGAQAAGAETEMVDLTEVSIAYCTACSACHIKGICPEADDIWALQEKMLNSEGIVLASPVYFSGPTAQLKTLIDRMAHAIHCQLFLGIYGCSVVNAGGPEYESTIAYLNDVMVRLGCAVTGGVGCSMSVPGSFEAAQEDALALGKDLVRAIQEQRSYPDQDARHAEMRERFKRLVTFNKDNWPNEYEYWERRAWL